MRIEQRSIGAALAFLAACGGEPKGEAAIQADTAAPAQATAAPPSTVLLCGADTVSVQGASEEIQLHVRGETFPLRLTPSASGAKYQVASDSTTFYWNHGDRSLVQVRGDLMPECEMVPGA